VLPGSRTEIKYSILLSYFTNYVFVTKPYPSQGLIYSIKYMVLKEEISWKIE
jgi:hypothetical protein